MDTNEYYGKWTRAARQGQVSTQLWKHWEKEAEEDLVSDPEMRWTLGTLTDRELPVPGCWH